MILILSFLNRIILLLSWFLVHEFIFMPISRITYSILTPKLATTLLVIVSPIPSKLISVLITVFAQSMFLRLVNLSLIYVSIYVFYFSVCMIIAKPVSLNNLSCRKYILPKPNSDSCFISALKKVSIFVN